MEAITFNIFSALFRMIGFLMLGGILAAVLMDIQKKAFDSRRQGLLSMRQVNEHS